MSNRRAEIMMVAGEVSGDLHGANLARTLLSLRNDLRLFGTGGPRMEKEGVELIASTVHLSTVGIIEALRFLPEHSKILKKLDEEVGRRRPQLILLIDNQGFNLQLAKRVKRWGIPILYWFAPQIWAFGSWQAKKIARLITHILAVFQFEEEAYLWAGAKVSFVGHPFLDTVHPELTKDEAYRYFGFNPRSLIIGLLPGSRYHEISRHLPILIEAAKEMVYLRRDIHFLVPVADPIFRAEILKVVERFSLPLSIVQDHFYDALNLCRLIITASGSVTLEATILKIPMIIIYKMSHSSWLLSRLFVKTPFAGLPNILAKGMIVPELLQTAVTAKRIVEEAFKIIDVPQRELEMKENLTKVIRRLGEQGGLDRAARIILGYL